MSKIQIHKELYFPTAIYYADLENAAELNLFLKTRIHAWRDADQAGIVRSNERRAGAWHSPTTMSERAEFAIFNQQVSAAVASIFQDQDYHPESAAQCHNMWANINPAGGYNRSHTHPGSLWSGVYYVQSPSACGRVVFQDPRAQAQVLMPSKSDTSGENSEGWAQVFFEPKPGRLILFPSWLQHEVESNQSRLPPPHDNRICISFNYGQAHQPA